MSRSGRVHLLAIVQLMPLYWFGGCTREAPDTLAAQKENDPINHHDRTSTGALHLRVDGQPTTCDFPMTWSSAQENPKHTIAGRAELNAKALSCDSDAAGKALVDSAFLDSASYPVISLELRGHSAGVAEALLEIGGVKKKVVANVSEIQSPGASPGIRVSIPVDRRDFAMGRSTIDLDDLGPVEISTEWELQLELLSTVAIPAESSASPD